MKIPFSDSLRYWVGVLALRKYLALNGFTFSVRRASMLNGEILNWNNFYLPIDLRGKTVLDVGAGEGETCKFFLEHGAKKVIAIEADPESCNHLIDNSKGKNITVIPRAFQLSDLTLPFDFLKCDIEGYEEALLNFDLTKPAVVEVHGLQLRDRFQAKGYKIVYGNKDAEKGFTCVCYAYWRC